MNFRILSYRSEGRAVAGILSDDDEVTAAGAVLGRPGLTVEQLLEDWDTDWPALWAAAAASWHALPRQQLSGIQLLAPIARPGQVFIAGSNYSGHADEMLRRDRAAGSQRPPNDLTEPWHNLKAGRACIVGPEARVEVPFACKRFDWEAELAVVIGRAARNVSPDQALDHVAGYMIANDLSARDRSRRSDAKEGTSLHIDWLRHKSFAGALPMGPWLTPREQVCAPQELPIELRVNGEIRQKSSTSAMIFDLSEQIASLSRQLQLFSGDIILTGTPGGTGASHGRYLEAGDVVEVTIGNLGVLRNTIVQGE